MKPSASSSHSSSSTQKNGSRSWSRRASTYSGSGSAGRGAGNARGASCSVFDGTTEPSMMVVVSPTTSVRTTVAVAGFPGPPCSRTSENPGSSPNTPCSSPDSVGQSMTSAILPWKKLDIHEFTALLRSLHSSALSSLRTNHVLSRLISMKSAITSYFG